MTVGITTEDPVVGRVDCGGENTVLLVWLVNGTTVLAVGEGVGAAGDAAGALVSNEREC